MWDSWDLRYSFSETILIVIFLLFEVQNLFKIVFLTSDRSQTNNPLRLSVEWSLNKKEGFMLELFCLVTH